MSQVLLRTLLLLMFLPGLLSWASSCKPRKLNANSQTNTVVHFSPEADYAVGTMHINGTDWVVKSLCPPNLASYRGGGLLEQCLRSAGTNNVTYVPQFLFTAEYLKRLYKLPLMTSMCVDPKKAKLNILPDLKYRACTVEDAKKKLIELGRMKDELITHVAVFESLKKEKAKKTRHFPGLTTPASNKRFTKGSVEALCQWQSDSLGLEEQRHKDLLLDMNQVRYKQYIEINAQLTNLYKDLCESWLKRDQDGKKYLKAVLHGKTWTFQSAYLIYFKNISQNIFEAYGGKLPR